MPYEVHADGEPIGASGTYGDAVNVATAHERSVLVAWGLPAAKAPTVIGSWGDATDSPEGSTSGFDLAEGPVPRTAADLGQHHFSVLNGDEPERYLHYVVGETPTDAQFPISIHASDIHDERRPPDIHLGDSTAYVSSSDEVGEAIADNIRRRFDLFVDRLRRERGHDEDVPSATTDSQLRDMAAKDFVPSVFADAAALETELDRIRSGCWKQHQNPDGTHPSGSPQKLAMSRWTFHAISGYTYEVSAPTVEHLEQIPAAPRTGIDI